MNLKPYVISAAVLVTGCGMPTRDAIGPNARELTPLEAREVDQAAADANCFCRQLLIPNSGTCTFSTQSFRQAGPARQITDPAANACAGGLTSAPLVTSNNGDSQSSLCQADIEYCEAHELELKARSLARPPSNRAVRDGLLRSARQRYLSAGRDLSANLSILAYLCPLPPSGGERLNAFGAYFGVPNVQPARIRAGCQRLEESPAFAQNAIRRVADAAASANRILSVEIQSAYAASDGLAPSAYATPAEYATAMWGPTGVRYSAIERIAGTAPSQAVGVINLLPANVGTADRLISPLAFASASQVDEQPALALDMLERYRVPTTMIGGGSGERLTSYRAELGQAVLTALFNLLDHRIAAEKRIGPYAPGGSLEANGDSLRAQRPLASRAELLAFGSLAPNVSPLRAIYGLDPSQVSSAMDLAFDRLSTSSSDYTSQVQVGGDVPLLATQTRLYRARDVRIAAALLQDTRTPDEGFSDILAPFLAVGVQPPANETSGPRAPINWYGLPSSRADGSSVQEEIGALGTLNQLRVLLRRLKRQAEQITDDALRSRFPASELDAAVSATEGLVGNTWTEFDKVVQTCTAITVPTAGFCPSPTTAGCLVCLAGSRSLVQFQQGQPQRGQWRVYFPPSDPFFARSTSETAIPLSFVLTEQEAMCRAYGIRRGVREGQPCNRGTAYPVEGEDTLQPNTPDVSPLGVQRRTFVLDVPAGAARLYMLWERDGEVRLVDVIDTQRQSSVHAIGGELLTRLADVEAKDATNPIAPAVTSLGLPSGFVPPLENEITGDNGNDFEDSWRTYLDAVDDPMTGRASIASQRLTRARNDEIAVLSSDRERQALSAQAVQAQAETAAEVCGDGPCTVERRLGLPLAQLIKLPPVPANPETNLAAFGIDTTGVPGDARVYIETTSCAVFLAEYTTRFDGFLPRGNAAAERAAFIEAYLLKALACGEYAIATGLRQIKVRSVPTPVVDELVAGGDGDFTVYAGQLREVLIDSFQSLRSLEQVSQEFATTLAASRARVKEARERIATLGSNSLELAGCWIGKVVQIIGAALGAALSIIAGVIGGAFSGGLSIAAGVIGAVAVGFLIAELVASGEQECGAGNQQAIAASRDAFASTVDSLATLNRQGRSLSTAVLVAAQSDSVVTRLEARAALSKDRQAIEERTIGAGALAATPEWRVVEALSRRRADDALVQAQRRAFIARRALEYRLAVRMSAMTRNETLTPPPAGWVNEIFVVDTATSGSVASGDLVNASAEALEDHARRLRSFIEGYPFGRRFAEGRDRQVLSLDRLTGQPELSDMQALTDPLSERFRYKCRARPEPLTFKDAERAGVVCGNELGGVEWAEIQFSWPAAPVGYLGERLARNNFNYRLRSLALNIMGTAVIDCSAVPANQRVECYSDGNVQYTLRVTGRAGIENHDRQVVTFDLEPGVIESARALTAERTITQPLSTADSALISGFERRELWGRPLMGAYTLRILPRPGLDWTRMEDVQFVCEYDYWTRQE